MSRDPFIPTPEKVAAWRQKLGLDADNLPLTLTPAERQAATTPEPSMPTSPSFVPPKLRAIAAVVASIGGLALVALPSLPLALPAWVSFAVFALTAIACFLAGLALPTGLAGKPLVPLTAVPIIASLAAFLGKVASDMPDGTVKNVLMLVVALMLGAAGVVTPAPGQPLPAKS